MGIETDHRIEYDHRMSTTCVQTSVRPGIGYHHQPIIGQSPMLSQSPEPAWQYGSAISAMVKQEPIDEARNDSGITSGSDGCPSASPGSDRSENNPYSSPTRNNNNPIHNQTMLGQYTHTPNYQTWYRSNFMNSPGLKDQLPDNNDSVSQISNGSNGYQPSLSPKIESGDETFDNEGDLRVPKVNSHGKIKVHKCKQCEFVAYTKMDFWEHSKMHIKGDKILKCPKCPFVTEYKHHLEYHLLNHAGAKPFKCDRCDYSCVNKSMLNSHLKSHSKVYQYRCQDCLYETKYCHSLKLHLRKYKHKPAMVLNPDGSPNPLPIIDVYGTRRGPKIKKPNQHGMMQHPEGSLSPPMMEQSQPNSTLPFNPLMNPLLNQNQLPFPFPLIPGFPGTLPNPEILQNIQRIMRERFAELQRQHEPKEELNETNPDAVLDLSKHPSDQTPEHSDNEEEDDHTTTMFSNVEVVDNHEQHNNAEEESAADSTMQAEKNETDLTVTNENNNKYTFTCQFCEICFNNEVMFRIHMGYHGFKSVFTCNMCGEECIDKQSKTEVTEYGFNPP